MATAARANTAHGSWPVRNAGPREFPLREGRRSPRPEIRARSSRCAPLVSPRPHRPRRRTGTTRVLPAKWDAYGASRLPLTTSTSPQNTELSCKARVHSSARGLCQLQLVAGRHVLQRTNLHDEREPVAVIRTRDLPTTGGRELHHDDHCPAPQSPPIPVNPPT